MYAVELQLSKANPLNNETSFLDLDLFIAKVIVPSNLILK